MLDSIAKLASKYNIRPIKKMSQNFIYDENLCDKIVRYSGVKQGSCILEIGPGVLGLTKSIVKTQPKQLTLIELDDRCIMLIKELRALHEYVVIRHVDALKVKLREVYTSDKLDIISNLPYNIGSKLLINWVKEMEYINSMTLMFQKDVAERILAKPNSKSYGRLSIISQVTCNIVKCFDINPRAFFPRPKVWSTIIKMTPKNNQPSKQMLSQLEMITQASFSQRRKMIKSSLQLLHVDINKLLISWDIDPKYRADNLTVQNYLTIAKNLIKAS